MRPEGPGEVHALQPIPGNVVYIIRVQRPLS